LNNIFWFADAKILIMRSLNVFKKWQLHSDEMKRTIATYHGNIVDESTIWEHSKLARKNNINMKLGLPYSVRNFVPWEKKNGTLTTWIDYISWAQAHKNTIQKGHNCSSDMRCMDWQQSDLGCDTDKLQPFKIMIDNSWLRET
jgi:hypothetical protein